MANPTTNFGWVMPTATDLVTDLPADFAVFGQGVDTSMAYLLGGTTGQILSKTSATNMAFTWIANDQGDLTAITGGTGITVTSGTGPIPSVAIDTAVTVDLSTAQTLTTKTLTAPKINLAFNAQTIAYTLVATDSGKLVTSSNASAVIVTIPPSIFAAGEQINVQSIGVGLTSFAAGAGVTITSTGAAPTAPILRARYSAATIICTASNVFTVIGDLS